MGQFLTTTEFKGTFYPSQTLETLAGAAISYFNFEELDLGTAITAIQEKAIANSENIILGAIRGSYEASDIPADPTEASGELKQLVADYAFWYLYSFLGQEEKKAELFKSIRDRLKMLREGDSQLLINVDEDISPESNIVITTNETQVKEPFGSKFREFYFPTTE